MTKLKHDPEKHALGLDPRVGTGFPKRSSHPKRPSVPGTNRTTQRLIPGSVVRGSDELRGENVPDGAWRAARSRRNPVHGGHCYLAGTAEWPRFLRAGSRHSGAATGQCAILRNELAGHSPDGNRCSSVGIGGRFVALANRAAGKQ